MKKIFSLLLCLIMVFSIFSLSAYAVDDRGARMAPAGTKGILNASHSCFYYNAKGERVYYPFPKRSIILLMEDLYTNDEYGYGTVFDPFNDYFCLSDQAIPASKIDIPNTDARTLLGIL